MSGLKLARNELVTSSGNCRVNISWPIIGRKGIVGFYCCPRQGQIQNSLFPAELEEATRMPIMNIIHVH